MVVVRKEIRKMARAEQERYAAALNKIRENVAGPGTSPFFKLAVMHGGMPPLSHSGYPEYCAHRRECFPHWHRPYLLEFEHALRRADLALGGDGALGLPYWNWSELDVNGEVFPKIVRERCMEEFPSDFFPVAPDPGRHGYRMSTTKSDADIRIGIQSYGIADDAAKCLLPVNHAQHASTAFTRRTSKVSVETPHNKIHGIVGGIMASFQSSFHPIFWLHHNNVDRIFEGYIRENPDSFAEFEQHQSRQPPNAQPGFPQGPWGEYLPFKHPKTGATFHARDTFDCRAIGFDYDEVPTAAPPQMREPPYLAVFESVDVTKLDGPGNCYVYVRGVDAEWVPPTDTSRASLVGHAGFAGVGTIFFIDNPMGCANCVANPTFDLHVEVTAAMRSLRLHPRKTALDVIVEKSDGSVVPLSATAVPAPTLRGPRLGIADAAADGAENDEEDVRKIQELLSEAVGAEAVGPVDGLFGLQTAGAVKAFQAAAGLKDDGIVGPRTKQALTTMGLRGDGKHAAKLEVGEAKTVTWSLDKATVPATLINGDRSECAKLSAEISSAFAQWATPTGLTFEQVASGGQLSIAFTDRSAENDFVFDGPGGALAEATPAGITFDAAEKWELLDLPHPHRKAEEAGQPDSFWADASIFSFAVVCLHEAGHVIGLGHSDDPADVMSPYYIKGQLTLSEKDKAAAAALYA